jgi:exodeoxyribonuclease VII large subunit
MTESYISVTQINNYIKDIFEAEIMLQNICVFGEVGSFSVSGGNAYFNLKDESGMLSCVLFGAGRFDTPKVGDMVLVRGSMSYYAKGGRLSFNAYSIMPYGRGLLFEKFLQLKAELESRGYFLPEYKKPIPERCKRIGVVSSPTGAVIRDIIDVTQRRNDMIDIVLYPVKVQGLGADKEIASGIDFFSQYEDVDVVIVARGGGSMEDLEPFNSEIVATATYNCKKPIVSAVGHETDFTIIDYVADLRAPTPSAAAELVAWDKSLVLEGLYSAIRVLEKNLLAKLMGFKKEVLYLVDNIDNNLRTRLLKYESGIDKQLLKLDNITAIVDRNINNLDKLSIKLETYNPKNIAKMGYSKILKCGRVVTSAMGVDKEDTLSISMVDGTISCKVL